MTIEVGAERFEFKTGLDILDIQGRAHKILTVSRTGMMLMGPNDTGKCFWRWDRGFERYFIIGKFNVRRSKPH